MIWRTLTRAFLSAKYVRKIELCGTEEVYQRPRGAASLEKYVIDLQPRCAYRHLVAERRICHRGTIACQIRVDHVGGNTVAEAP